MSENEQPPADPRLLAALAKADLDELVTRLLGLARRKMCGRWKGLPPSGETPEDVVQKAFHQALSGVRKFPRENVGLYIFFVMVVRSLISHLAEKEENRYVHTPIEESRRIDGLEAHAARGGARGSRGCRERAPEFCGGQTDDGLHPAVGRRAVPGHRRICPCSRRHRRCDPNMNRRLARYRDRQRRKRETDERPK